MGKYMRKRKRIGEFAVMEVSPVVGVRTRARTLALAAAATTAAEGSGSQKRRKAGDGEFQISYLQLRSRMLVLTPEKKKMTTTLTAATPASAVGSSSMSSLAAGYSSSVRCPRGAEWDRISRCSSNASCEIVMEKESSGSGHSPLEGEEGFETTACKRTPSREPVEHESDDLVSTARLAEWSPCRKSSVSTGAVLTSMPSEAEIEEFFVAAEEEEERKRFVEKYNYDLVRDTPLDGRYEWIRLEP